MSSINPRTYYPDLDDDLFKAFDIDLDLCCNEDKYVLITLFEFVRNSICDRFYNIITKEDLKNCFNEYILSINAELSEEYELVPSFINEITTLNMDIERVIEDYFQKDIEYDMYNMLIIYVIQLSTITVKMMLKIIKFNSED